MSESLHCPCSKSGVQGGLFLSHHIVASYRRLGSSCILDGTNAVKNYELESGPKKRQQYNSALQLRCGACCEYRFCARLRLTPCIESSCYPNAAHLNLLPSPRSLSTDLAANVEPDPGTLMPPIDLGEQVTPTRTPCPNARSGLCGCPVLGRFPSTKCRRQSSRGEEMADLLSHPGPCPFRRAGFGLPAT